jgi:hypothetical protein
VQPGTGACRGAGPSPPRVRRPRHLGGAEGPRHPGPAPGMRLTVGAERTIRERRHRLGFGTGLQSCRRRGAQHRRADRHHRAAYRAGRRCRPPGEVAGFGILDHADTRDPVGAAAANPVIRGPCPHARAEHRYRPGRRLQHRSDTATRDRVRAHAEGAPRHYRSRRSHHRRTEWGAQFARRARM